MKNRKPHNPSSLCNSLTQLHNILRKMLNQKLLTKEENQFFYKMYNMTFDARRRIMLENNLDINDYSPRNDLYKQVHKVRKNDLIDHWSADGYGWVWCHADGMLGERKVYPTEQDAFLALRKYLNEEGTK